MNKFVQKTKLYIDENDMLSSGSSLVVGLSGGADSVALLRSIVELAPMFDIPKERIIAVHVNHGIRGEEALADEEFCRELCASLNIQIKIVHTNIPELAKEIRLTEEEAGRYFRYKTFAEVVNEFNEIDKVKIAVAHNANDVAETVLFNLVRGSSLDGVSGIKPVNDTIIRPILWANRSEIEEYLLGINQKYCVDSTNLVNDYSRNIIRNRVLPLLEEINPSAVKHINYVAKDIKAVKDELDSIESVSSFLKKSNNGYVLLKSDLLNMPDALRNRVVHNAIAVAIGSAKDITRNHIGAVVALLELESGKSVSLPKLFTARNNYDEIIIEKNVEGVGEKAEIETLFKFEIINIEDFVTIPKNDYNKAFDYDKIAGNVCVRTPYDDDYMIIDKVGHTKKLKRIFTDAKVDRTKRLLCPVIATGDEVLWAVGVKDSQGYLVSDDTKNVLSITYLGEI